jgi:hypothetical protein
MFVLSFSPSAFDAMMVPAGSDVDAVVAASPEAALVAGAAALDSAYASWIASGDVKPARLSLLPGGSVMDLSLLDYGVSKDEAVIGEVLRAC